MVYGGDVWWWCWCMVVVYGCGVLMVVYGGVWGWCIVVYGVGVLIVVYGGGICYGGDVWWWCIDGGGIW